jgi:hypothetical protein
VAGTPGTPPTNWATQFNTTTGLTIETVGTGTDSGISYIDIKISGTASGAGSFDLFFDSAIGIAALTGQTLAASLYWKLQAGSTTGLSSPQFRGYEYTAAVGFIRSTLFGSLTFPASAALNTQRFTGTATLSGGATTAFVRPLIAFNIANATAIDITLRIGLPQLEQGAFATSPIPTTTAAVTRSADVASITGSAFSSWYRQDEGVLYADGLSSQPNNVPAFIANGIAALNDNSTNNRVDLRLQSGGSSFVSFVTSGGAGQATLVNTGTYAPFVFYRSAIGYAVDNFARNVNSGSIASDTSGLVPVGVNRLWIGAIDAGTSPLNGTIKRLTYWPQRLSNASLQQITQ